MKYNKDLHYSSTKFSSNPEATLIRKQEIVNKTRHILHAMFFSDAAMYFFLLKTAAESLRIYPKQSDLDAWFNPAINCESLHPCFVRSITKIIPCATGMQGG